MDKNKVVSILFAFIVGISFGLGGSYLIPSEINTSDNYIKITTLTNGEEVHSIVVIDAIFDKGDNVSLTINGEVPFRFKTFPYEWNNMLKPAGNYEIVVGVEKDGVWIYDNLTIVIPEVFVVPENYSFTEDFVVHEGQTVYMNYSFDIASTELSNGWNSPDEKTYYAINNFGTLYIYGNITCSTFVSEGNSKTYWYSDKIICLDWNTLHFSVGVSAGDYIRYDDNAVLYIDRGGFAQTSFPDGIYGIDFNMDGSSDAYSSPIVFLDNSSYEVI